MRRDFEEWKVHRKYLEQEGVCAICGNPLNNGFHRHHKDGDPSNNSYENLQLLCPSCHFATFGKDNPWAQHKKVERKVMNLINEMINRAFKKELSGATMERMMDGFIKILQLSRREKGIDEQLEYPPPTIKLLLSENINREIMNSYLEGFKDGVRSVLSYRNKEGEK